MIILYLDNKIINSSKNSIKLIVKLQSGTRAVLQKYDNPNRLLLYSDGKKLNKENLKKVFESDSIFKLFLNLIQRNRKKIICPHCKKPLIIKGYVVRKFITTLGTFYLPIPRMICKSEDCDCKQRTHYVVPEFAFPYSPFHEGDVIDFIIHDGNKESFGESAKDKIEDFIREFLFFHEIKKEKLRTTEDPPNPVDLFRKPFTHFKQRAVFFINTYI